MAMKMEAKWRPSRSAHRQHVQPYRLAAMPRGTIFGLRKSPLCRDMTGNGPPVRRNELLFNNSLKYEGLGIARWMEKSYDKDCEIRA
jgi:hypothetical protein